jgi:hypothetical protein
MPRYSLRTLLILLAIGPPILAGSWTFYRIALAEYREYRLRQVFAPVPSNPWVQITGPGFRHFETDEHAAELNP